MWKLPNHITCVTEPIHWQQSLFIIQRQIRCGVSCQELRAKGRYLRQGQVISSRRILQDVWTYVSMILPLSSNTHWHIVAQTILPTFCRSHFQMQILEWKCILIKISAKFDATCLPDDKSTFRFKWLGAKQATPEPMMSKLYGPIWHH